MTQASNSQDVSASSSASHSYMKLAVIRIVVLAIITGIGFGIAKLGGGEMLYTLFSISLCIQFIFFLHGGGVIFGNERTEKYYDLSGSFTYITLTLYSVYVCYSTNSALTIRQFILSACLLVWCIRLGLFLFSRIHNDGGIDSRFVEIKKNNFRFLVVWGIQALWVFLVGIPVYAVMLRTSDSIATVFGEVVTDYIGIGIWLFGFMFEVVADHQKSVFKAREKTSSQKNKKRVFINEGLWHLSRHPNYFGEIMLWIGLVMVASGSMITYKEVLVISVSPLLTTFLLCKVSGIPKLEKASDDRWGGQTDYEEFKLRTPVLIPNPFLLFSSSKRKENVKKSI